MALEIPLNLNTSSYCSLITPIVSLKAYVPGILGEGGLGTLVEVSQNFLPLVEVIFSQKWTIFGNFRDISTKTTSNTTFYCIFIKKNFPKISKRDIKKFSRRLRRRKIPLFSILALGKRIPPWRSNLPHPPKKLPDMYKLIRATLLMYPQKVEKWKKLSCAQNMENNEIPKITKLQTLEQ